MPSFVPRKHLTHEIPGWVADGAVFFVTVCAKIRGENSLATPDLARGLLESVRHRHEDGTWFVRLFLIMPDHVHALISVPPRVSLVDRISQWKRFVARTLHVEWQDGFFDHRLRPGEEFALKARYIRENPVRAGLVAQAEEWPWVFAPEAPARLDS